MRERILKPNGNRDLRNTRTGYLVSNGEFHEFVEDRGYGDARWWDDEGLAWKEYCGAEHPRFWVRSNGRLMLRNMLEIIEMPWDWPVEVNYLEAKAFCNWKSARSGGPIRLPTEDEWYLLRDRHVKTDQPYWERAPGNLNLEHYASSCPVTEFQFGDFCDIVGNVWQWTETPISGFHGFEIHPYYDDFSTPTFDGKHNLIKGGSWISTGNEARSPEGESRSQHSLESASGGESWRVVVAPQIVARRELRGPAFPGEAAPVQCGEWRPKPGAARGLPTSDRL